MVNLKINDSLSLPFELIEKYQGRADILAAEAVEILVKVMENTNQAHSDEEEATIRNVEKKFT